MSPAPSWLALGLVGALGGCSGAPSDASAFPLTVTSDRGALRATFTANPDPPIVGTNEIDVDVTRASDGSAVDGLTITVAPFMPAMDHGTSGATVTPTGHGHYRVQDVYLFMPGRWELETSFTGPVQDHAAPSFELQ